MNIQATRPGAACQPSYKQGPLLIESLGASLIGVLGEETYNTIREGVLSGHDVEIEVSDYLIQQLAKEYEMASKGILPEPRSGGPRPEVIRTKLPVLPWRARRDLARGEGKFMPHPSVVKDQA